MEELQLCTVQNKNTLEPLGKKYRKTIPFTIVSKKEKIKYLGINFTKNVNDLYKENYEPLKKEIKDYRRWKRSPILID
jgi:hypothetical protein